MLSKVALNEVHRQWTCSEQDLTRTPALLSHIEGLNAEILRLRSNLAFERDNLKLYIEAASENVKILASPSSDVAPIEALKELMNCNISRLDSKQIGVMRDGITALLKRNEELRLDKADAESRLAEFYAAEGKRQCEEFQAKATLSQEPNSDRGKFVWSTEAPTVAGPYWVERQGVPSLVDVFPMPNGLWMQGGGWSPMHVGSYAGSKWAGPIPVPLSPTVADPTETENESQELTQKLVEIDEYFEGVKTAQESE